MTATGPFPRILSLHPHLDGKALWSQRTRDVRSYDPEFFRRSPVRRLWTLRRIYRADPSDVTVFSASLHRGFVLFAAMLARHYRNQTVFAESYLDFDTSRSKGRWRIRAYRFLLRFADLVTAQSTFERVLYERVFGGRVRCRFVPWYAGPETCRPIRRSAWRARWREAVVLCPGRYRDLLTFVEAVRGMPCRALIVCGPADLETLARVPLPDNVEVETSLSITEYGARFDRAAVVVLPFAAGHTLRSLGHVAYFAATVRSVPVLSSATPHLADYVKENEVLLFRAGDVAHLRDKLAVLLNNPGKAWLLARSARKGARGRYSAERHITALLDEIGQLWSARVTVEDAQ
jgi:glycosyltransferase involved in cell wall biosynthesis